MAAPNLLNLTTITGKGPATLALTTSAQALVNNPVSSGKLLRVVSITVSNVDGTNAADLTLSVYPQDDIGGTAVKIAHLITVPAKATLIICDKNNPIYLEEDRSIGALASANSDLEAVACYEELS